MEKMRIKRLNFFFSFIRLIIISFYYSIFFFFEDFSFSINISSRSVFFFAVDRLLFFWLNNNNNNNSKITRTSRLLSYNFLSPLIPFMFHGQFDPIKFNQTDKQTNKQMKRTHPIVEWILLDQSSSATIMDLTFRWQDKTWMNQKKKKTTTTATISWISFFAWKINKQKSKYNNETR